MQAIGVEIKIEDCQIAGDEVISSVRSLTLHVTSSKFNHKAFSFANVAAQFPNVGDLQLFIDDGQLESRPDHLASKLSAFKTLTSLSLEVKPHGDLDLTMLNKLLTFSILSDSFRHKLKLPQSIQRVVLQGNWRADRSTSHEPWRGFLTDLNQLANLRSLTINRLDLTSHRNLLELFPISLSSLDVQYSRLPDPIGKPHSQLKELRLVVAQGEKVDLSAPRLELLTCLWHMQTELHVNQLKVLFLGHNSEPEAQLKSFKQFPSLTELWMPAKLLTEKAIKDQGILGVFPSALEILVISKVDEEDTKELCWDFSPLKHLRSLGLTSMNLRIESSRLPRVLHTLAVHISLVTDLREGLRKAKRMTRVATMTYEDWSRGPLKGGFLSTFSEGYPEKALKSLQNRRRDRDAWHHQLHKWNAEAHSSHHATTTG